MNKIPKKIHYVWVGEKEKTKSVINCIETWKMFLPDYEIIEWNNRLLAYIDNNYVKEAVRNKKWAFVSDYLRLYVLFHEGGVYLDTDIEITKNIDRFLSLDFFMGYEVYGDNKRFLPMSALIGSTKGNRIIKDLLNEYDDLHFETKNGLDLTPNTLRISHYFSNKFNFTEPYDGLLEVKLEDNAVIYPYYYFCTPCQNHVNFSIHHFNASWKPSHSRKDKLTIFKKFIISRFKKQGSGEYPINDNEKIILSIKVSKLKSYVLIKREN